MWHYSMPFLGYRFTAHVFFSSVIMGIIGETSQQGNNINDEDTEFVISKIQSRVCLRKSMIPRPASLEEGDMFVRIIAGSNSFLWHDI